MSDVSQSGRASRRGRGPMSEQRRQSIRLDISREAARLFWEQGVADTTGEQIAEGVGLSVSTVWRYFRNKESCVEPIVARNVENFVSVLRRWPRESSLEDHYASELASRSTGQGADELLARQVIVLAETEPALRAAWLIACDRVERELVVVIAERLERPADDLEMRLHAAAVASVLRVLTDDISIAALKGSHPVDFGSPLERTERVIRALRIATGGIIV